MEVQNMTINQIKIELAKKNGKLKGNKDDLAARLQRFMIGTNNDKDSRGKRGRKSGKILMDNNIATISESITITSEELDQIKIKIVSLKLEDIKNNIRFLNDFLKSKNLQGESLIGKKHELIERLNTMIERIKIIMKDESEGNSNSNIPNSNIPNSNISVSSSLPSSNINGLNLNPSNLNPSNLNPIKNNFTLFKSNLSRKIPNLNSLNRSPLNMGSPIFSVPSPFRTERKNDNITSTSQTIFYNYVIITAPDNVMNNLPKEDNILRDNKVIYLNYEDVKKELSHGNLEKVINSLIDVGIKIEECIILEGGNLVEILFKRLSGQISNLFGGQVGLENINHMITYTIDEKKILHFNIFSNETKTFGMTIS